MSFTRASANLFQVLNGFSWRTIGFSCVALSWANTTPAGTARHNTTNRSNVFMDASSTSIYAPPAQKFQPTRQVSRQGTASAATIQSAGHAADDDHVVVVHFGSSSPACSRTMYSAYQSGQFGSALPMRFSCSPCAADARRIALARSFADAKVVVAGFTRPGSRAVIS